MQKNQVLRFQIDLHFADESNKYFSHDRRHVTAAFSTGGKLRRRKKRNLPKKKLSLAKLNENCRLNAHFLECSTHLHVLSE